MSDATLERIIAEIRSLSPEQREQLRHLLNGTPVASNRPPEPPFTPRIISTNAPIKDRTKENEWLRQHRDEYARQWVALDGDRLVSHHSDGKVVIDEARQNGFPDALIVFVEPSDAPPLIIW